MPLAIDLAGFPSVLRARVTQGCGSTPGRAVVDCVSGEGAWSGCPDTTTLTMSTDSVTCQWNNMRVTKAPRMRSGYMRVVLEDSRWRLRHALLGTDYNAMNAAGVVLSPTAGTYAAMLNYIGSKSTVPIIAGGVVPTFPVPMAGRGVPALTALERLLKDGVCRLHYSPTTGSYTAWSAGTGPYPNLDLRLFVPAPQRQIRKVLIRTAPILYEGELSVSAVAEDGTGDLVLVSDHGPNGYFDGFASEPDPVLRGQLRQGAFRLWKVDQPGIHLQDRRADTLLSGAGEAKYKGARLVHDDLSGQMYEQEAVVVSSLSHRGQTGSSVVCVNHPFLESSGGSLKTTAKLETSYYSEIGEGLIRAKKEKEINATGTERVIDVHWIKPIQSSSPEIPTTQWGIYLDQVAVAYQNAFNPTPHTVTVPGLVATPPSGHIGAVEYFGQVRPTPNVMTRIALDFDPEPGDLS